MALDVVTVLQRLEPFSALDITALQALVTLGEEIEVQSGALVIQAGAVWDGLYVVTAGRVRLVNERTTGSAISIDTFQEGTYLGEHSFFAEVQAGFSVYGDAPETTLLRLSSARLAAFLAQHPALSQTFAVYGARRALEAFLASAATPVQLPVAQLVGWMQSWHTQTVQSGECLIREDDSPDALYIVLEGHFNVYQGTQPAADVRVLRRGDVIGDLSLVTGQRLPGNVVAATLATVWVIPKAEFLSLLLERQEFASSFDSLIPQAAPPPEAETAPQSTPAPADQAAPPPAAPEPASPRPVTKLPWRYRFGRLPAVRQQSTMDCGAACLATVCRYYGKRVSLNRMRDLAHVGTAGASMLDLMRAAITLGYDSEPYLATYDHLMAHALPAIVNWRGYHWIVVYQVTPKQVTVADPGQGVRTMSKDEFLQGWTRYTLYMQPTEALAALEDSPPTLRQFIPYVKPYKRVLYEILLASLSLQIFSLLMPLFTKFVIDEVITKQHVQWFVPGLVVLSGVMVLHTVLSYCRQRLLLLMSLKTMSQMVSDFYTRLLSLPLPFFERRKVGDITSRFEENQKITNFLTHVGLQSFLDLFTAFMYVGLMAYLNLHLTLVACSFVMFHILIVQYITPYLQHAYRDVFQKGADSQSFIIESLSGLRTLKTLGVEHMTRWRWEDLNIRFSNAYFQSLKFGSLSNLASGLVNNLSDVAVLFYGASMVLRNQLTLGELVAFTVLTQGLSAPLMKLVGLWDVFQETLTAVERLNDVLETAPEVAVEVAQNTITLPPLRGYVRFEHLTFRYAPDSKQNVLQNITLDVQPGQRVAFVGRSGSGKSTLLKLLCRFYRPSSGTIYLDGFDLAEVALPSLRPQIGIVPQNVVLFPGTIRDNIALARPDTGLAEVIEAAQLAVAHDFISTLPHGYDTVLAEGGSNLSGGQRQRLAIARAMLHAPRLLILDEATSALDNETERLILRNLDLRFKDRTVFMIAHRLSTVQHAHLIVVIEKGLIFEQGTHEELMAQRGLYYFLQTQQLSL